MSAPVRNMASRPFRTVLKKYCLSKNTLMPCTRLLCTGTSEVDTESRDPAPIFLKPEVQRLLYKVTGFNLNKIFPRRYIKDPSPPKYQLLTDEQLKQIQESAISKGKQHITMPPVMMAWTDKFEVLSEDPEIEGFSEAKHVFTDVTFGVPHKNRLIVVRESTGTLRHATPTERDHIIQVYYPRPGKMYHMPDMFTEQGLERVLMESDYEYILQRASVQFEPDDPEYIRVTHRTYEHLAENSKFHSLRSTRYFGTMTFYLVFYKRIEKLLVDMIQRDLLDDAADTVKIYHIVHPECPSASTSKDITDPQLLIQEFIKYAQHGGIVELALQTYNESQSARSSVQP